MVARRASAAAAGPAAKKTKLRRSNRKRGSKLAGLKLGDAVDGNYGPLVTTAGSARRSRSTLRGVIVAEAGNGVKNCWHVRWEGVDPSLANSREQKCTADGIFSSKLKRALEVSDIDDDDSSVDAADLEEEEESDSDDSSGNSEEEEDSDEDLSKADRHFQDRQNSDYYLIHQVGKKFTVDGFVWTVVDNVDEDTVGHAPAPGMVTFPRFSLVHVTDGFRWCALARW